MEKLKPFSGNSRVSPSSSSRRSLTPPTAGAVARPDITRSTTTPCSRFLPFNLFLFCHFLPATHSTFLTFFDEKNFSLSSICNRLEIPRGVRPSGDHAALHQSIPTSTSSIWTRYNTIHNTQYTLHDTIVCGF